MRITIGMLVICTAGIALRAADPAMAAPLAPTKPSQAVTVQSLSQGDLCVPGEPSLGRRVNIKQNGDGTTEPFTIPPKTVFVVTSVDVSIQGAPASRKILGGLYIASAQQVGAGSNVAVVPAESDADGLGNGTMTLPSGFPVKSGANLCFLTVPPGSFNALVHGFFAKDK